MVKIRELSDKQLISQLEKYEKIYNQLTSERDKRADSRGDKFDLMTAKEKEQKALNTPSESSSENSNSDKTQAFQLKFDDAEIDQMEKIEEERSSANSTQTEEVRVTQLLKLSQDQLDELRKPSVKKVVKKKKVLKKKSN